MIHIRENNGDIRICIDLRNLNKACKKDNFPLPTMEQILQSVADSELIYFLDGFSGYNKILVHLDDRLKQHSGPSGEHKPIRRCLLDSLT